MQTEAFSNFIVGRIRVCNVVQCWNTCVLFWKNNLWNPQRHKYNMERKVNCWCKWAESPINSRALSPPASNFQRIRGAMSFHLHCIIQHIQKVYKQSKFQNSNICAYLYFRLLTNECSVWRRLLAEQIENARKAPARTYAKFSWWIATLVNLNHSTADRRAHRRWILLGKWPMHARDDL